MVSLGVVRFWELCFVTICWTVSRSFHPLSVLLAALHAASNSHNKWLNLGSFADHSGWRLSFPQKNKESTVNKVSRVMRLLCKSASAKVENLAVYAVLLGKMKIGAGEGNRTIVQSPPFFNCLTFHRKRANTLLLKAFVNFRQSKETSLTGCAFYAIFMHRTRAWP